MELIGKTTINPVLFYTGKISGYIIWVILVLSLAGTDIIRINSFYHNNYIPFIFLIAGLVLVIVSLLNLGKSTRLGLPVASTKLKTNGLYRISRNPMYVGFNLFTIASMIYTLNVLIILPGVYSIIVYHLIIKAEERFLISRFGDEYQNYMMRVRRYL